MRTRERYVHPEPVVEMHGNIVDDLRGYTRRKVSAALADVRRPIAHSHVRVVRHTSHGKERPVTAHATIALNGTTVSVHADAATPRDAVDRLVDRLEHQVERAAAGWEARRGRTFHGEPHDFPHTPRGASRLRPPEERQIIRHTTASPAPCSVDDAVAEMDDLGHNFHLFVEATRGVDSIVYRAGPTGIRFAQTDGRADDVPAGTVSITTSTQLPPLLDVPEAVERLDATGMPFLFYLDADHGRGCVLYQRYDGHYGLVDPMAEGEASSPS